MKTRQYSYNLGTIKKTPTTEILDFPTYFRETIVFVIFVLSWTIYSEHFKEFHFHCGIYDIVKIIQRCWTQ